MECPSVTPDVRSRANVQPSHTTRSLHVAENPLIRDLLFRLLLQLKDGAAGSTTVKVGKPARVMNVELSPLGDQLLDLLVHIVDLPGYMMYPLTPRIQEARLEYPPFDTLYKLDLHPADIRKSHPDFPRSALDVKPAILRISPWSKAIQS